ncbi:MAG: peptidylprolyl isomerase [Syntrophorhabdales bacterium]|jgi:FKBP-type peptidyl-prolyl cis-trans isomerase SlyD
MIITKDKAVTLNYTLSDEKGEVLETSKGREPLTYVHGAGLIRGFETALEGKSANDAFSFTVTPEEGYGERRPELVFQVNREQLHQVNGLSVGQPLRVRTPDGAMVAIVASLEDDKVVLDANHPLSGITLTFDVEVLEVRDATAEELSEARQTCGCGTSCGDSCGEEGCGC